MLKSAVLLMCLFTTPCLSLDCVLGKRSTFNIGSVLAGSTQGLTINFRNTTNAVLHIGEIKKSCTCMSPQFSFTTLAPNALGVFTVDVRVTDSERKISNSLTVECLDEDGVGVGIIDVVFNMKAVRMVNVENGKVQFGLLKSEGSIFPTIRVTRGTSLQVFSELKVETTISHMDVRVKKTQDDYWEVSFIQRGVFAAGALIGDVSISPILEGLSRDNEKRIGVRTLSCAGVVHGDISISSSLIFLGNMKKEASTSKTFTVSFKDAALAALGDGSTLPQITVLNTFENIAVQATAQGRDSGTLKLEVTVTAKGKCTVNHVLELLIAHADASQVGTRVNILLKGSCR